MWTVHVNGSWQQVESDAGVADLIQRGLVGPTSWIRHASWPEASRIASVPAFAPLCGTRTPGPASRTPSPMILAGGLVGALAIAGAIVVTRQRPTEAPRRAAPAAPTEARAAETPAAGPSVGAVVHLVNSDARPIGVSKRPDRWGDEDILARLAVGTPVTIRERRDFPLPDGTEGTVRFRVEFLAAGKKTSGWVHGWAIPGASSSAPASPGSARATTEEMAPGVVVLRGNYVAAVSEAQLDKAAEIVASGDRVGFDRFVRGTPGVFLTVEGMKVSLVDAGLFRSRVRRFGATDEFWVDNAAIRH